MSVDYSADLVIGYELIFPGDCEDTEEYTESIREELDLDLGFVYGGSFWSGDVQTYIVLKFEENDPDSIIKAIGLLDRLKEELKSGGYEFKDDLIIDAVGCLS